MARQVPAAYSLMMVRDAEQAGVDLLSHINIHRQDIESREFIDLDSYLSIIDRYTAWKADEHDWGFRFGERLGMASHGPLGFGALSAGTVGEGLAMFATFLRTRAYQYDCTLTERADALAIDFDLGSTSVSYNPRTCETLAMVFQSYLETVGASTAPTVWYFPYAAPDYVIHYGRWLKGGFHFDAEVLRLEVPRSVAMLVSPFHDEAAHRSCRAQCESLLAAMGSSLEDRVAAILTLALDARVLEQVPVTRVPVVEDVARELDMSRRTLIRRLQQAGTSFQAIKDLVMREHIRRLVAGPLSLQQVADRLGYCDAGNFSRACRRLFGRPPSELRATSSAAS